MKAENKTSPDPITSNEAIRRADYAREKGEVVLREHEYDGIQEYDQKLPNWWLYTLWVSIAVFLIYYTLYYTLDLLPSSRSAMDQKVEEIQKLREAELQKTLDNLTDETLVNTWASNPQIVAAGKQTYTASCVACHAADMGANGGMTGRPLNDGEWFYGSKPMDVFNMILHGTPADSKGYEKVGGMRMAPMGGAQLTPKQVAEVTAYLIEANPKDFASFKK